MSQDSTRRSRSPLQAINVGIRDRNAQSEPSESTETRNESWLNHSGSEPLLNTSVQELRSEFLSPQQRNRAPEANQLRLESTPPLQDHGLPDAEAEEEHLGNNLTPPMNYSNLRYILMPGKRINSKLLNTINEEQLYVFRVSTKKQTQYDCWKKIDLGCKAKVFLDKSNDICFRNYKYEDQHNHAPVTSEINELKLKNEIKSKCGSASSLAAAIGATGNGNVRGIFQNVLATLVCFFFVFLLSCFYFITHTFIYLASSSSGNGTPPPNFYKMQRNLRRIRNVAMPKAPTTPQQIIEDFAKANIMQEFGMTQNGTDFYRTTQIEQQFSYCIFASKNIIDEIEKIPEGRRNFYMDGTFKVVPFGDFNQLLIIYTEFFQKVPI